MALCQDTTENPRWAAARSPYGANGGGWIFLNIAGATMLAPMDFAIALGLMQAARAVGTGIGPLLPQNWSHEAPWLVL